MKNYLFISLFIGCKNTSNVDSVQEINSSKTQIKQAENYSLQVKDSLKVQSGKSDSNTIDSLKIGATFYNYKAFKGYRFIETEPYEFISVKSDMRSTQLMAYQKKDSKYLVLVTASGMVESVDYNWQIIEKKIEDIVVFSNKLEICWHITRYNKQTNSYDTQGIGIGKQIKELKGSIVYSKEKILITDYENGKIKAINDSANTFMCTDGL